LLRGAAEVAKIDLGKVWISNATLCLPPQGNKKALNAAAKCCAKRLEAEVTARKPRIILAVGDIAMKAFGIKGQKMSITKVRGMIFGGQDGKPFVIPALHPSYLLRDKQDFTPVLVTDMARAARIARFGRVESSYPVIDLNMKVSEVPLKAGYYGFDLETKCGRGCPAESECTHAIDIRTAKIRTVGISWMEKGRIVSTSFAWGIRVERLVRKLWGDKNAIKVMHNMSFDRPITDRELGVGMR
jgi:uracil-DNA glycosylase family 4